MYFLIGIWGYDRRIYAAVKFILYTMAGSVLMLIAIIGLAYAHAAATGTPSFNLIDLYGAAAVAHGDVVLPGVRGRLSHQGAAVPVPHLAAGRPRRSTHRGLDILAGVMLKMGTYGLLRFAFPLFPSAAMYFAPWIAALAVVGIVYGALVAMVQPDMKKLVAYSSVSHLGFVVLGCAR